MATFHISRAEAAKDFDGMLERVRNGDEVVIEENLHPAVVIRSAGDRPIRLSEALRCARERGSTLTLDGGFEADLNAVINSHPEPLIDPNDDPWA